MRAAARSGGAVPHAEIWGVGLCVAGLLAALGIWVDVAGPFGEAIRAASWWSLGVCNVALPILLAWTGGLLVRGRNEDRRRIGISVTLLIVAVDGLGVGAGRRRRTAGRSAPSSAPGCSRSSPPPAPPSCCWSSPWRRS